MNLILIKTAKKKVIKKKIETIWKLKERCVNSDQYQELVSKNNEDPDIIMGISIRFCDDIDTTADTVNIGAVDANVGVGAGIGGFNAGEGEYLPIVKVAPIYPNRALSRGIEGWCIVEYTVTRNGTTAGGKVVECTSSLFASASLKASSKFKYKPRVINGTPIDVPGVQHKITFELEK